jgi:ribosomal protein S18 acetylase RimI-like enzyme
MSSGSAPADALVRPAVPADLPAIIHVYEGDETGGKGDIWSPETAPRYEAAMRRILASADNALFVAERAGRVVGTLQLTFLPGLVARGRLRAKLESVHVRPEQRGQRVGEAMVRHAIAFARAHGAELVELTSNKQRRDAHRFYERLGFERSHEGFKMML